MSLHEAVSMFPQRKELPAPKPEYDPTKVEKVFAHWEGKGGFMCAGDVVRFSDFLELLGRYKEMDEIIQCIISVMDKNLMEKAK
jgi:hypothetical protein